MSASEHARQTVGGEPEEIGKYVFGYPAGKARMQGQLVPLIPDHKIFVEPFCGSAAVFFNKPPCDVEVLSDRDPEVIAALRAIKGLTKADLEKLDAMPWIGKRDLYAKLKASKPKGRVELLHRFLYVTRFSYHRMRARYHAYWENYDVKKGMMRRIARGRERMHSGVKIMRADYREVAKAYNTVETFWFFDPPYPGYDAGVGEKEFDEDAFRKTLDSVRGRFLVTYGTRGKLKTDGFHVRKVSPPRRFGHGRTDTQKPGEKKLDTLLITNYALAKNLDMPEEMTLDEQTATNLAQLGALAQGTAGKMLELAAASARVSSAGIVGEIEKAAGEVLDLGDLLAGLDDAEEQTVDPNPKRAGELLSEALTAALAVPLPDIVKAHGDAAAAALEQFAGAVEVLASLDDGDMPTAVGKLALAEITPERLRKLGDREIETLHAGIHKLFDGAFKSSDKLFAQGVRRDDVLAAEMALQAEMSRRNMPHRDNDALAAEVRRALENGSIFDENAKADLSSGSFPKTRAQSRLRRLPAGLRNGRLDEDDEGEEEEQLSKRVLSTRERNDFPDSSFLYIKPGGDKDREGKTVPRSLRMFPVRDKSGQPLLAQIRNALARIPQANISQGLKDQLAARARRMLEEATKRHHYEKADSPLFEVPIEKACPGVLQAHFVGRSMHLDFRVDVGGHLVGWTIDTQRGDAMRSDVATLEDAAAIAKTFSFDGDRFGRSMRAPFAVPASPKARQPTTWLDIEGAEFSECEPGASTIEKGVLVAVARPDVEFGLQLEESHEYFLGGDTPGVLVMRKSADGWRASVSSSHVPHVLRGDGELPPLGVSALPESLRGDVPPAFRFWEADDIEKATRMREALIKSRLFDADSVRLVAGRLRRVVKRYFLASEVEATDAEPWPQRVEKVLGCEVSESFGALRTKADAVAYFDAGCDDVDDAVASALDAVGGYVITAKDSPDVRGKLALVGEVFKFVPDATTALDAIDRVFVSSQPVQRIGDVEFIEVEVEKQDDAETERKRELWGRWRELVNMSPSEIEAFLESDEGQDAGLSEGEASEQGIGRGRDSARALLRMLPSGRSFDAALENWTANDWRWAGRQVSFISRMSGASGPLMDGDKMTRKLKSLLIWGHDPRKVKRKSLFDEVLAREIPLLKTADERFVLGIVLEPETRDAQGDIYSAEEVRTAAHAFMEQFQNVGFMHRELINHKVSILESYIAPADFEIDGEKVQKGTWLFATRINDPEMWAQVKAGALGGYSIGGSAVRVAEGS